MYFFFSGRNCPAVLRFARLVFSSNTKVGCSLLADAHIYGFLQECARKLTREPHPGIRLCVCERLSRVWWPDGVFQCPAPRNCVCSITQRAPTLGPGALSGETAAAPPVLAARLRPDVDGWRVMHARSRLPRGGTKKPYVGHWGHRGTVTPRASETQRALEHVFSVGAGPLWQPLHLGSGPSRRRDPSNDKCPLECTGDCF